MSLPIQSLHIGMKALTELTADIPFDDARRTIAPGSSELIPAEPTAAVSELQVPLRNLILEIAHAVVEALKEFHSALARKREILGQADGSSASPRTIKRCQDAVNRELPSSQFYIPLET